MKESDIFESNDTDILESLDTTETETVSTSEKNNTGINELLEEFIQPTENDAAPAHQPAPGETGPGAGGSAYPSNGTGAAPPTSESRKKAVKMFWRFIDFVFSALCSVIVSMISGRDFSRERYKSGDADLQELTEALYDYELATGKKVAGTPLTNLLLTIGAVYSDRVYMAVKDARQTVSVPPVAPGGETRASAEPEPEPEPEPAFKRAKGRPSRGGPRIGSGRHKSWCMKYKGKDCNCRKKR